MPNKATHLKHGGKWLRPERRWAIYLRDNLECVYCEKDLSREQDGGELTLDHLDERGGNHETNLVTACKTCNTSKGGKSISSFASATALRRIEIAITRPIDVPAARQFLAAKGGKIKEGVPEVFLPPRLMAEVAQTTDKNLAQLSQRGDIPVPTSKGYDVIRTLVALRTVDRNAQPTLSDLIASHKVRQAKADADNAEADHAEKIGEIKRRIEKGSYEMGVATRQEIMAMSFVPEEMKKRILKGLAQMKSKE